jgi:hypothetical protein
MPWGISHSYGKPPFKMNKSSMGDLQDPKMEVPTVYKAYCSGLFFSEYHQKILPNIWY